MGRVSFENENEEDCDSVCKRGAQTPLKTAKKRLLKVLYTFDE